MNLPNIYREYFLKLRRICVHEPYIILYVDICPKLRHYIKLLDDITLKDGSYHTYYGDIKTIINSYTKYWTDVLDEAIKESDKCIHSTNKNELLIMLEKTIDIHKLQQTHFEDEFSECDNPIEREQYNELNDKYADCMNHLNLVKEHIKKLDKQEKIDNFTKIHFTGSLKRKNNIFACTCDFISMQLSLVVDRIKISLEEILNRLRNNVRSVQEQLKTNVSDLLMRLYEKNKENRILSREDIRLSTEITELRRICVHEPYIILYVDICPKLRHYIKLLDDITLKDGSYHTYYGDIKTIINSYTKYWTDVLDEAIKESDKCIHSTNKNELLIMLEKTIDIHKLQQTHFEDEFSECDNPIEREQYNELNDKYADCMNHLNLVKEHIKKLDKQEKIDNFTKIHFTGSLKRKNNIFACTCDFISMQLSLVVDRIKISLEEILNRLRNNVRSVQEQLKTNVSDLLMRLYEKNKENRILSREDIRLSTEITEVERSMDIIKDKIEDSKHIPLQRLNDEHKYWEELLIEFELIATTIKKLEQEESNLLNQEKLFASEKDLGCPYYKQNKLEETCGTFERKLEHVKKLKQKAAKALLTFFDVRGDDRIYYTDNIGTYFMDNYGHQVYVFDYGLNVYHVNCQGEFIKHSENDKYYYDDNGRFTIENDKKLYKIQPCTSQYEMQNGVFIKHTKDCGHSEKLNEKCRMQVKDPNDVVLLPDTVPIDIKGKLEPDVIKYLWDAFGHILPDAMNDVVRLKPKNPIHCLAHKLLYHKYKRSSNEMKKKKEEAAEYRQKIYQDEIERERVKYESWRAKQGRVRPERDDHSAVLEHHAEEQFIRDLNYYN